MYSDVWSSQSVLMRVGLQWLASVARSGTTVRIGKASGNLRVTPA